MNRSARNTVRLVNPVGLCRQPETPLARRLDSLQGKSIGFIDNIKANAGLFLSCVEEMIRADYAEVRTHTVRKNFTSSYLIADQLVGKVDGVVNAWGD